MSKHNESTLKEALEAMIKTMKLKPKLYQSKLESIWKQKMGTSIARHTTAIRLRGATLYLTIDSAPLKQELSFSKKKIASMINKELGETFIEEVVIR